MLKYKKVCVARWSGKDGLVTTAFKQLGNWPDTRRGALNFSHQVLKEKQTHGTHTIHRQHSQGHDSTRGLSLCVCMSLNVWICTDYAKRDDEDKFI